MAKKKLSRDQKRKQKKQRRLVRRPPHPTNRLVRRIREHGFEQEIVSNPPGQIKMSEVLRDFLAPYWHIPEDEEAMRSRSGFLFAAMLRNESVSCWNKSCWPNWLRSASATRSRLRRCQTKSTLLAAGG